jgi:hypothetical protein
MSEQVRTDPPAAARPSLSEEAAQTGKTVAEVVADRLARPGDALKRWGVPPIPPKPAVDESGAPRARGEGLRRIRGIITGGPGDVSIRHHEYLGQSYLDTHDEEAGGD